IICVARQRRLFEDSLRSGACEQRSIGRCLLETSIPERSGSRRHGKGAIVIQCFAPLHIIRLLRPNHRSLPQSRLLLRVKSSRGFSIIVWPRSKNVQRTFIQKRSDRCAGSPTASGFERVKTRACLLHNAQKSLSLLFRRGRDSVRNESKEGS